MDLHTVDIKKSEDVLITTYRPGTTIAEKDAIEIDNAHLSLSSGQDMFILADLSSEGIQLLPDAEYYFMKKGRMIPYTRAVALVGGKVRTSAIINLLRRKKSWYEYKSFDTAEEAYKWFDKLRAS